MIKSSLIKTGIITVLAMLILCGCGGRTGKEPDAAEPTISGETNKPTASVEANRDALQSIDPVYTQSPENVNGTVVPNESPENNNMDNSNQTSNTANNDGTSSSAEANIQIVLDKNTAKKDEIITAKIILNNIPKIAGYQVNIKYDPNILQAVDLDTGKPLEDKQIPGGGDVLSNPDYNVLPLAASDVKNGVINFAKAYVNVDEYKESNNPESSGVLALIGFKVLKEESTVISFADTPSMPNAVS